MTPEATPRPCRVVARPALPGSWSTMSVTSTGSFGSGTEQVRTTR